MVPGLTAREAAIIANRGLEPSPALARQALLRADTGIWTPRPYPGAWLKKVERAIAAAAGAVRSAPAIARRRRHSDAF